MYHGNMTDNKEQGTFELNICGPVSACGEEKDGIGACLTKNGTKIALGKVTKDLEYKGEIVTLVYRGGDNFELTGQQREVHIKFYCNPKKPFGEPTFTGQEGNKYFFDFQTSLVCTAKAVQCSATSGGKSYDLTPLGLTAGNWEAVDTRPQDKHLHYFINICRSVNPTTELMKCPGGAIGACQIDHNSKRGFNLGYVQSDPKIAANGELSLQYSGGSECHHQFSRSIRIVFSCSKIMGSPIFLAESPECEYLFSWQTPSACPLTVEYGNNCTVEDKQYGYMFNLFHLYKNDKDYNVSVSGAPGVRIILNVCNKLVKSPKGCGENAGACILDKKFVKPVSIVPNNSLAYYNGRINMTYGGSPSLHFTFTCNQGMTGQKTGPACEKKNDKKSDKYECHWQTEFACRPMGSVQCSIRNEDGTVDDQYDYSLLSKSERNWQARIPGPNLERVAYFINVCRTVVLQKVARRCPPTAGVCMVKGNKYYNLGTIVHGPRKENGNIYLLYENGDDCGSGKNYSSRVQMECGDTEGEPVYVTMSKQTCVYEFLWITSTACPVNTKIENVFDNCTAVNPQTKVLFNLQSLKRDKDYVIRDKDDRILFTLNVCRKLVKPNGCGSKSGVCQHDGQQVHNAGNANSRLYFDDGVLYLNLSGGEACHHVKKNRETIIQFVCNASLGSTDPGKPVYISENDCTYYIVWHTSLVCERQYECAATKQVSVGKGSTISTIKYSLGRLMRTDANWLVTSEDGFEDSYSYYVNLCRPLVPMPGTNCPAGAWACRVKKQADQDDGKHEIQSLGHAVDPPTADDSGEVRLIYVSSTDCKDGQNKMKLHFTFTCAYGSLGHPVLQSVDKCVIHIRWATSAACPEEQTAELDKCRVFDNSTGEYYSLKPLSNCTDSFKYYQVGADNDPQYFFVSICDGLLLSHDEGNCTGAGICLVANKTYTPLGLYAYKAMTYFKDEGMLILKYCSARCDSKDVTISRIIFVCDRTQRGNGKPELNMLSKDSVVFAWRTSLVCPPLEEECSFIDGNSNYNLQLLTSRTRNWYYEHNRDRFWINICRGISDGPPGCPATASVCMERGGSEKVNIIGLTSTQMMSMKGGKLQLTYSGLPPVEGCTKGSNSKVVFSFECGNHVGQPQFVREDWSSCSFIIKWKSSVACQIKREKIEENNCVLKHPVTGGSIDFKRLVHDSKSTWKLAGKDENNQDVSYFINVCGNVDDDNAPDNCNNKDKVQICFGKIPLHVQSKTFYYEGSIFSLELETKESRTVVINFQCSLGEGVGSPKFDYVSSNNHYFFTWPTSIVCSGDLSHDVTDIPEAGHKTAKSSTKKNVGIVFGVLFAVLLIVVFAVVFYKPSRRHSIISCVRMNFKRHVLRKEIKFPVYRYQKLDVSDDDEADALIKEAEGSEEEVENDDDDLLPF